MDIVEVSPPYDHAEITAYLANRVALEALSAIAARKVGIKHDPAGPLLEGR
jgi:agmatinase